MKSPINIVEGRGRSGGLKVSSERVVSAGGVIFRRIEDKFEVALVSRGKVWYLPKGLIERGESAEEAALREVREETGLEGKLVGKIGEINYSFSHGRRYLKTVHFYLFNYVGGSVETHDSEGEMVRWFSGSDAARVLTYINEKRILAKAMEMLTRQGGSLG
jgi:8-oxo-dGTP pyrophosphatase MutT (NUDIX family)